MAFLREFGFPIFVCLWFMTRMERKVDAFLVTQSQIMLAITVLAQTLDVELGPKDKESPPLESPKKPEGLS
jgi:hypothetical protein